MLRDHLLDVGNPIGPSGPGQPRRTAVQPPSRQPLPVPSSSLPISAVEAASQLLTFLEERPSHPGHVAIVSASGCSPEELREECVVIDLDAVQLMDCSPALGEAVLSRTEAVRVAMMGMLHSGGQLQSRYPRLYLRLSHIQVPVKPSPSIMNLASLVIAHSSSRPKGAIGGRTNAAAAGLYGRRATGSTDIEGAEEGDHGLLVSFSGVVLAASSPWMQTHSRCWDCPECSAETQTLGAQEVPSGCYRGCSGLSIAAAMPRASGWQQTSLIENMSERVMVPARDMWLGDLSSALGPAAFGVGQGCVLVRLIDDLAMPPFEECNVGDILAVVGRARAIPAGCSGTSDASGSGALGVAVEVAALSCTHCCAHAGSWGSALGRADPGVQSLQQLCDCLVESLGAPVPHPLCLALLVSAASVVARPQLDPQQRGLPPRAAATKDRCGDAASSQLGVLVVQLQPHDPTLVGRILRPAAHVLSPHSCWLRGAHEEDPILPRLQPYAFSDQEGQKVQVVRSSALTAANRGVMVIDGATLGGTKRQLQLAEVLAKGSATLGAAAGSAKAADRASLTVVPVTATVWAASHGWPEGSGAGSDGGTRRAASATASAALAGTLHASGFDLVLSFSTDDDTVMRSVLYGGDDGEEGGGGGNTGDDGPARRLAATAALHSHMHRVFAGEQQQVVVSRGRGGFSPEAVQLLQVASLVARVARGCAKLMPRGVRDSGSGGGGGGCGGHGAGECAGGGALVQAHPDCTVAILLVETTLRNRFGRCYQNSCMPLDLELADGDVSLDDQLLGMHQAFSVHLQMVAPTASMASPSVGGFGFGV